MKQTKRQVFPTGLWIVATPIGNLSDFSNRGIQALEEADFILCEDTRRTGILLSSLGLDATTSMPSVAPSKLVRLDAHASEGQVERWVGHLEEGVRVALVSDAGTPAISDPGAKLISRAHERQIRVVPIPGPSAVPALLSVAGFQETSFSFRGFFPRSSKEGEAELAEVSRPSATRVHVWFESPHRILSTVQLIEKCCPDAIAVCGKELTKIHEKIIHGAISEVTATVQQEISTEGEVGEWCFALRFPPPMKSGDADLESEARISEESAVWKALQCLLESGIPVSEASKKVSQIFGVKKKSAYNIALQISGKKSGLGG